MANDMVERVDCENPRSISRTTQQLFDKKIWRVKDAAEALGVTVGHIYNLVSLAQKTRRKTIPFRKKGKLLFFIPDEIIDWIHEGE